MDCPYACSREKVDARSTGPFLLRCLGLLLVTIPVNAAMANWQIDPVLRAAWDFDDNSTLSSRTDQEKEISGYIAEASADFVYRSDRSFLSARPILRSRNYGEDSGQNSDDQFLRLNARYSGQRHFFGVFGDYGRESVRTAELADADLDTEIDPGDISDDQSGLNFVGTRRERYKFSPRWSYRLSEVSALSASWNYLTVAYDEAPGRDELFDYTDNRVRFGYRHNLSARNDVVASLTARDFDTDRFGGDKRTYGFDLGFVRSLSERTQFRANAGIEAFEEDKDLVDAQNPDPQIVYDFSLVHRLQTIRLLAQYRQRVNATGRGDLTKRDEINLRLTRDLNDRFSAGIGLRAYNDTTISGIENEQTYVQLRGQVIWRLSRSLFIQADYRNTVLDRDFVGEAADSNRITVWFTYQPNPVGRQATIDLGSSNLNK
jgi:hypothetical protein